jgi:hypothetical protein
MTTYLWKQHSAFALCYGSASVSSLANVCVSRFYMTASTEQDFHFILDLPLLCAQQRQCIHNVLNDAVT